MRSKIHSKVQIARLFAAALLCDLFLGCGLLLRWYSGIFIPFYVVLVYGALLASIHYQFALSRFERWYSVGVGVAFVLILAARSATATAYDDRLTGQLMLLGSIFAWSSFVLLLWLILDLRYPVFSMILTTLIWAFFYWFLFTRVPFFQNEISFGGFSFPRVIQWEPKGAAFFVNEDDEWKNAGRLYRFDISDGTGTRTVLQFEGIVQQSWPSPQGNRLATIIESGNRHHRVVLSDPLGLGKISIASDPQSFYFPFRSTQDPWSPDGKRLMFTRASPGRIDLWVVEMENPPATPRFIARGEGCARAYWQTNELLALPRGDLPTRMRPGDIQSIEIYSATTGQIISTLNLEERMDSLYAYSNADVLLLKRGRKEFLADTALEELTPVQAGNVHYLEPAFSPDGSRMAYTVPYGKPPGMEGDGLQKSSGSSIRIFNRDTGETREIYAARWAGIESLVWSPDGKWIAFSQRMSNPLAYGCTIMIVSPHSGKSKKIGWQTPAVYEFYQRLSIKPLLWRPSPQEILFISQNYRQHAGAVVFKRVDISGESD